MLLKNFLRPIFTLSSSVLPLNYVFAIKGFFPADKDSATELLLTETATLASGWKGTELHVRDTEEVGLRVLAA